MAKINTTNYQPVTSWNGTQDLLIVEQPDGTKVATPEQIKQFVLNDMDEVPTQDSDKPVESGGVFNAIEDSVSIKTATGNPITLTDAANANAEELSMAIEPIQDLHGYSKPWPGGGGKNIAHIDSTKIFNTNKNPSDPITGIADGMLILGAAANGYIRTATLGSYTINNTNSITAEIVDNASFGVGIVVEVDDTKTYTLNLVKTGGDVEVGWLNNDGSSLSSAGQQTLPVNLTPPTGAKYLMIVCLPGLANNTFSDIQLEVGTSASTFEPWENICPISGLTSGEVSTTDGTDTNTATITLGQTVYGGSVDFKTGEVTVTHGMVDLGTLNWNKTTTSGAHWEFISNSLSTLAKFPTRAGITNTIKCSIYTEESVDDLYHGTIGIGLNVVAYKQLIVCDETYSDAAAFKTAMSGVQLCYELATPTTLTLTPAELELLRGGNIITGNGAEVSIEYYPDNAVGALARRVDGLTTPTLIWNGYATDVGSTYSMTRNYTDFKYLLVTAKTNYEEKNILIPTSSISATDIYGDVLSTGEWNANTNAFTYNSSYGIKFTAANAFQLVSSYYNNANWVLRPIAIYGIG